MSETQNSHVTIAIDAMGGDYGCEATIPAIDIVCAGRPNLKFMVFGDQDKIMPVLAKYPALKGRVDVVHADKVVSGHEKPSAALRSGKGSSMRLAIEAVAAGYAQAVVSAGNTGALMAMAKVILRPVSGIHRPAIASIMPGIQGDTVVLDLGANVLVDAENLVQFAILGSIFAKAHKKIERPRVGLLNIGSEEMKGPEHVRGASEILAKVDFPGEYVGFVEGDDIGKGTVDVIVADGYAGNIALKTMEGAGKLTKHYMLESFNADPLAKVGAFFAYFSLKRLKRKMDPRLYNGGVFLGLNGLCIKSHGGADALGFSSALLMAARLARSGYMEQVVRDITHLTSQESFLTSEQ